jgi:hypothetical protein
MGFRNRGGGWAGPWPGRGPFSYLPPWERPGRLYGFGQVFDKRRSYLYSSWAYARFPWLSKRGWPYPQHAYPLTSPATAISPKEELAALEDYVKKLGAERLDLEHELKSVELRIKELKAPTEQQSEQEP